MNTALFAEDDAPLERGHLHLLSLPTEIRVQLYIYLFQSVTPIKIESQHSSQQSSEHSEPEGNNADSYSDQTWTIRRPSTPTNGLSSQVLLVCREIYTEAHPYLYRLNMFDCSSRSSLPLLQSCLSPITFPHIRHLILDWEHLQDFAWSLAKPGQVEATRGLQVVELGTWRMRVRYAGGTFLWRDVKSYERQLCQAALDICRKHAHLRLVLEREFPYRRKKLVDNTTLGKSIHGRTTQRVKWRFVTEALGTMDAIGEGEKTLHLQQELHLLTPAVGKDLVMSVQGAMDPI